MGGSILPVENFADEVVVDDDGAAAAEIMEKHPSELGAQTFDSMSVDELKKVASDLAAMPSDGDRIKSMESMSSEVKEVLTIMLKGMGIEMGERKAITDVSVTPASKPVMQPEVTPPAKEGFNPNIPMGKDKNKSHSISPDVVQSGNVPKIEPFDGDQYALY